MPNLLICASTFPRSREDTTVDFIWQQASYFKKHYPTLNIHILAPHDSGAALYEMWDGVHIHRYRYFWPLSLQTLVYPAIWPNIKENRCRVLLAPFLLCSLFFAAMKITKKHDIELIYSHWFMPQGLVCSVVAKIRKIPQVLTSHAADIIIMRKIPLIGKWLVRKTLPTFQAISFAGSRGQAQAIDFFTQEEQQKIIDKSAVIPMGVDFKLPPLSSITRSSNNTLKLTFVGRLAEKKGVIYLLKAMQMARQEDINVYLDILGDGPLLNSLRVSTQELGLDEYVNFHGFINGEEKFKAILECDLFVVPSIVTDDGDAEGLPVSLLEAMAAGAICCATDESGAPDIITNPETAFLVKAKSPDALLGVIKHVDAMTDVERSQMKENAKALGQSFKWDNMIHRHYDFLIAAALSGDGDIK